MRYEFDLERPISSEIAAAFPELHVPDGSVGRGYDRSRLCGAVADQAQLHGILRRIENLGLTIVELRQLPGADEGPGSS